MAVLTDGAPLVEHIVQVEIEYDDHLSDNDTLVVMAQNENQAEVIARHLLADPDHDFYRVLYPTAMCITVQLAWRR